VTGDPVLASVDVQSSTAATLTGTSMSFGTLLPGNTATGTETYSVGTNDAAGANVTATWDDSMITGNEVSSLVTVPADLGSNTTGFTQDELLTPSGSFYDQGMVNLSTLRCQGAAGICTQDTDIPWSQLSVTPDPSANGTATTFAYDATGGIDPVSTGGFSNNNPGQTAGQGGGSTVATVASFAAPLAATSFTDTYSLNVGAGQEAGIYASDLWYQVISN
jgi:hypothetical protein